VNVSVQSPLGDFLAKTVVATFPNGFSSDPAVEARAVAAIVNAAGLWMLAELGVPDGPAPTTGFDSAMADQAIASAAEWWRHYGIGLESPELLPWNDIDWNKIPFGWLAAGGTDVDWNAVRSQLQAKGRQPATWLAPSDAWGFPAATKATDWEENDVAAVPWNAVDWTRTPWRLVPWGDIDWSTVPKTVEGVVAAVLPPAPDAGGGPAPFPNPGGGTVIAPAIAKGAGLSILGGLAVVTVVAVGIGLAIKAAGQKPHGVAHAI